MIALSVAKLKIFFAGKRNFSLNKAKKEKHFFGGKFGSIPTFRHTQKGKRCFCDEPTCLTSRYYTLSHLHQVFSISLGFPRLYFIHSNFWSFKDFNKTIIIIPLRLLDTRLAIANSALRASSHWLFTISYPTHAHGIPVIVKYYK